MNALINTYLVKESVTIQMTFSVMKVVNLNMIIGIAMGHVIMFRNLGNLAMEPVTIQKTLCVKRNVSLKIKHGNAMVNVNIFANLVIGPASTQDKYVAMNVLIR